MPSEPLTLMAVHAHPDDEALGTGGILARYAAEGIRTVLVTCTDGSCGDGPGGVKPGEAGHDPAEVAALRAVELSSSAALLGVADLEVLGYRDSGMMGWESNRTAGAFWGMDVIEAARPLIALMETYRPQVVVTYDANGFYGHPDHIMAHRIAMVATAATGIPQKLYYTTVARSRVAALGEMMRRAGMELPVASDREEGRWAEGSADGPVEGSADASPPAEEGPSFGTADAAVTTEVDVSGYVAPKWQSLSAHASQAENIFFLRLDASDFSTAFGHESFVLAVDTTGAELPETDLFAGIRTSA